MWFEDHSVDTMSDLIKADPLYWGFFVASAVLKFFILTSFPPLWLNMLGYQKES